jgi:hypothetical protein
MCSDKFSSRQREAVSLDKYAVIPNLRPGEKTDEDKDGAE